ncbi:TPA: hypothetical protein ACOZSY_000258 [Enterococcus faecium]
MEGKTFAEIWTEFIEVPTRIDPITSEKVLDADFYNLKAGTSLECVWMYLEEHFKGVTQRSVTSYTTMVPSGMQLEISIFLNTRKENTI